MKRDNKFLNYRGRSEHGFTMVEILVGIMLLAGVIAVVTSTLINATQTSDKLTRGTLNQSKLLDAVSLITRDISLSKKVEYASVDALSLRTIEDGVESNVKYFYWDGSVGSIPDTPIFDDIRDNASLLSSEPSIVEYRVVGSNTSAPIVRGLIEGYNPGVNNDPLFLYFDNKNVEVLAEADSAGVIAEEKLDTIRRVQIHLNSFLEGRDKEMEIRTSASPRFMGIETGGQAGADSFIEKTQTPELYGDLVPRTRVAELEWTSVAGATSYTIYKQNRLDNAGVATYLDQVGADTTAYTDNAVRPGETYEYFVIAQGYAGDSDPSNTIRLRVTPDPTNFVYIQPTRGQDGSDISGFTVARNLDNQLSWAAVSGENINYKLYKIQGSTKTLIYNGPATTYKHTGQQYGAITRYTVVPYNATLAAPTPKRVGVTGGDAPDASTVDLISPPLAPAISVTPLNDTTNPSRGTAANNVRVTNDASNPTATCYEYFYGSAQNTATASFHRSAATQRDHSVAWGTSSFYRAVACNDAGNSPYSAVVRANQIPGPFDITSLVNNIGYTKVRSQEERVESIKTINNEGQMTASWQKSSGSTKYSVSRSVINNLGGNSMPSSFNYNAGVGSTTDTSVRMNRVHPGAVYRVTVTATAANGTTRSTSATLLTKPDVPQSGGLEAMCLANGAINGQQLGMYVRANAFPRYGGADDTSISFYRKQYGTNNYLSAPGTYAVGLSTNTFAWQSMSNYEDVGITYQNRISDARMRQLNPDFGRSLAERTSHALTLSTVMLAPSFGDACNHYTGGFVVSDPGLPSWGHGWVVPYNVCYGFEPGNRYTDAWYYPNNLGAGAVWSHQRQPGMVQNVNGGCKWRFAPGINMIPSWTAFI